MAGCLLGELDFTFLIDACLRHQNQVVCLCSLVNLPSIRACQGNLFSGSGMESTGSSSCVVFRCQRLDVGSCLIAVYSNDTILAACIQLTYSVPDSVSVASPIWKVMTAFLAWFIWAQSAFKDASPEVTWIGV